jgi:hypothetical protein
MDVGSPLPGPDPCRAADLVGFGPAAPASEQTDESGAVAVVTLVALHLLASVLRFNGLVGKVFDHRVRVPVANGEIRRRQLRRCGLTDNDLFTQLR